MVRKLKYQKKHLPTNSKSRTIITKDFTGKAKRIRFRSGLEEQLYHLSTYHNRTPRYEEDIIPYTIPETVHKYITDFTYVKLPQFQKPGKYGDLMIIEPKGMWRLDDRKKHLYLKKQYPNLDIRIVFERHDNKIKKSSKTTYGEWATKYGIRWASKTIPLEWFKEIYHDKQLQEILKQQEINGGVTVIQPQVKSTVITAKNILF